MPYKLCKTFKTKIDINKLKNECNHFDKKKENIHIIPFGSGSTGNSFYIEIGRYKLLIDCGIGMRKIKAALEKHNRNIEDIDAILITHAHSDHRSSIKAICNNTNCPVFATSNTLRQLERCDYKAISKCIECGNKNEILPNLYITAFETSHDCPGSCGYVIETNNTKISYATDLGVITKDVVTSIMNSDVIILESNHDENMLINGEYPAELKRRILSTKGHLSNRQSIEFQNVLYELGTKNFLLAHLSRENNRPELVKQETTIAHQDKPDINIYICPIETDEMLKY